MRVLISLFVLLGAMIAPAYAQDGFSIATATIHDDFAEDAELYGERDIERLLDYLRSQVSQELQDNGLYSTTGASLTLILNDAQPNRPTMEQLGDNPGLSYESFSRGGADLTAVVHDASGQEISRFQYDWYTRNISDAAHRSTWSDARRAISRFADQLSTHLQGLANT